ncbi:hypothetical protein RFI_29081 [Reticulomyxa filosa]|uniref:Uncharacterized protein n=1 Tax=Reticulomyxa filosa TaxID=46433 RepID=X6M2B3_RETFI|nr:hypothetical protein RFI_29081 [Reticulomyxa filosa]|eukprot:ETO08308.1 hypothetical protein RFI_29081 [Reticulomyxa filosa]
MGGYFIDYQHSFIRHHLQLAHESLSEWCTKGIGHENCLDILFDIMRVNCQFKYFINQIPDVLQTQHSPNVIKVPSLVAPNKPYPFYKWYCYDTDIFPHYMSHQPNNITKHSTNIKGKIFDRLIQNIPKPLKQDKLFLSRWHIKECHLLDTGEDYSQVTRRTDHERATTEASKQERSWKCDICSFENRNYRAMAAHRLSAEHKQRQFEVDQNAVLKTLLIYRQKYGYSSSSEASDEKVSDDSKTVATKKQITSERKEHESSMSAVQSEHFEESHEQKVHESSKHPPSSSKNKDKNKKYDLIHLNKDFQKKIVQPMGNRSSKKDFTPEEIEDFLTAIKYLYTKFKKYNLKDKTTKEQLKRWHLFFNAMKHS